jgi:hypothetical protein
MKRITLFALPLLILFPLIGLAQNSGVYLKRDFITKYKNKVLITSTIEVRHSHSTPKGIGTTASDDGDIHASGIPDAEIGLPVVFEVMNAKKTNNKYKIFPNAAENNDKVTVTGIWRLWFEHPGEIQTQGDAVVLDPDNTNPDHMFEIHPVTSVKTATDTVDFRHTFARIKDGSKEFKYKDPVTALNEFSSKELTIKPDGDFVGLISKKVGYNYIKFKAELLEKPTHQLDDNEGFTVYATILDNDGEELANKVRLVFVNGTSVANKVKSMNEGQKITLLGIPRVSLALVDWRLNHPGNGNERLKWNLPYELVILASF